MIYKGYLFSLMLTYLLTKTEPAKILAALPNPMVSHQMVFQVLTQELARRGHEVTVITAFPIYPKGQSPTNYIQIDVSEVANKIRTNFFINKMKISDLFSQFVTTFKAVTTLIEVLEMKVIQDLIRDKSNYFDLLILEDCVKSTLFFSHVFKAPVIEISSFGGTFETFEIVGAATHPFIYPLAIRKRYSNLSVWEKLSEFHMEYRLHKAYYAQRIKENEVLKKYFGSNSPTIEDLKKNINLVFLNIHPIWDSNRPVPPNVVYLGGLHQKPEQELPKDLKSALDSSTNGVIYVSFGTNIGSETLSPERLQIFIKAFAKLPYDIYWKWNDNNLPGLSENVKVLKWLPQSDILRHPKVKLFITQGGLQSTDEAIAGGVPLIGIPMMWDQWLNVDKYVQLKIGLQLDIDTVAESNLIQAIETVIESKSYKENIMKLYSVMNDREQTPLQRAVWWTEYILRHRGADHLRAPTANMTWMEYYDVELILFIFISLILIVGIFLFATTFLLRILVNKSKLD